MKKNSFILLIICSICISIPFIACSRTTNKSAINQLKVNSVESETTNENSETSAKSSDNSQIFATLIGGLCTILGGIAGAVLAVVITNMHEKKKRQERSSLYYYRLMHLTQLKLEKIGKEKFNIEESKKLLDDLNTDFEENADVTFYIDYHNDFIKYKNSLESIIATAHDKNYDSSTIYKSFYDALEKEKQKIQKKIV